MRPTTLEPMSVNQIPPSAARVMPTGVLGVRDSEMRVTAPLTVTRPTLPLESVNQTAPLSPGASANGTVPIGRATNVKIGVGGLLGTVANPSRPSRGGPLRRSTNQIVPSDAVVIAPRSGAGPPFGGTTNSLKIP